MRLANSCPAEILLSTVEKVAGYVRKGSHRPASFGLALLRHLDDGHSGTARRHRPFRMELFSAYPRQPT